MVVDASAHVEVLLRTPLGQRLSARIADPRVDRHLPELCDVEVASALGALVLRGSVSASRAVEALEDYMDFPAIRHPHTAFLPRIFALRENFSAYDAAYVVLAEALEAPLLSADTRLVASVRRYTGVETEPIT
jgi:predicted nucleic acid-binding protein